MNAQAPYVHPVASADMRAALRAHNVSELDLIRKRVDHDIGAVREFIRDYCPERAADRLDEICAYLQHRARSIRSDAANLIKRPD